MSTEMMTPLRANHYCKDLLSLDDQIVAVCMIGENGKILALDWKKERVPWEKQGIEASKSFENIESKLGFWMNVILGLSGETSVLIGSLERATFVHKNFQLVLFGSSTQNSAMGLMLSRSANIEHVANKVKEIMG